MKKILFSYGTRPEWIKLKPILDKAKDHRLPHKIVFTSQHEDLAWQQFDSKLYMDEGQNRLDSIISSILNRDHIFMGIDYVMVQGDTTSAFAMALAAFHRQIPVIHLEAGLRTYDMDNPYPEEFNRQAISRIAVVHFCPTKDELDNLVLERASGKMYITGNTVLDNLLEYKHKTCYSDKVLITFHRRENHKVVPEYFQAFSELALTNQNLEFILPLHLNPNVKKHKNKLKGIKVVDPLPYEKLLDLMCEVKLIISDSGGIQEEASFLDKKVIVCRKKTERTASLGTHSFLADSPGKVKKLFDEFKTNYEIAAGCPYGDGHASDKIMEILANL